MITSRLSLDPSHPIFKGHFPELPVLPGVCMIDMIKGVLEAVLRHRIFLKKAHQIKFLRILNPNEFPEVFAHLNYTEDQGTTRVVAKLQSGDIIFFKLDAQFSS